MIGEQTSGEQRQIEFEDGGQQFHIERGGTSRMVAQVEPRPAASGRMTYLQTVVVHGWIETAGAEDEAELIARAKTLIWGG